MLKFIVSVCEDFIILLCLIIHVCLQKTDAESSEEEEEKQETPKASPDADTVILFTKPGNQGWLHFVSSFIHINSELCKVSAKYDL